MASRSSPIRGAAQIVQEQGAARDDSEGLEWLRATLDAAIRAGGAHSDHDIILALDEEEASLAKQGY